MIKYMQKAMPAGRQGSVQILSLVVFLILILIGAYFFLPKNQNYKQMVNPIKNSESSTKVYNNDNTGIEFVYLKDFSVIEDTEEGFNKRGNGDFRKNFRGYVQYEPGKFAGAIVVLGKDQNYETNPFTLWVFDNPNNLNIDVWYKNYWYYPFVWGDFTYEGKIKLAPNAEATVSGIMAKSGVIDYQPGKPKFVYVSNNGKMYLFRIISSEGDKILESFKFLSEKSDDVKCSVGGCSGQLCTQVIEGQDNQIISTCEYKEEYGCYKTAKCEIQADGKCGWTRTEELNKCLQKAKSS